MSGDAKQEQLEKQKLNKKLGLTALEKQDFSAYMQALADLGAEIQKSLKVTDGDIQRFRRIKTTKQQFKVAVANLDAAEAKQQSALALYNALDNEDKQSELTDVVETAKLQLEAAKHQNGVLAIALKNVATDNLKAALSKLKTEQDRVEKVRDQLKVAANELKIAAGQHVAAQERRDFEIKVDHKKFLAVQGDKKQARTEVIAKKLSELVGSTSLIVSPKQKLAAEVFATVWADKEEKEDLENNNPLGKQLSESQRHLTAKAHLNKVKRTQVKLGLLALQQYFATATVEGAALPAVSEDSVKKWRKDEELKYKTKKEPFSHIAEQPQDDKKTQSSSLALRAWIWVKDTCSDSLDWIISKTYYPIVDLVIWYKGEPLSGVKYYEDLEAKAKAAIEGYKTNAQTARHWLGVAAGAITSFAFGIVETGVALALLLATTTCPVGVIYLLAVGLGGISTYVNWKTFKTYVPALFGNITGKNEWFDGLTQFTDDKGNVKSLSTKRKSFLAGFALLAALPTGVAIGALGYTSTIAIPTLPWLAGLGVGLVGGAIPPIGIIIAGIVAIAMTAMLVQSMANLLKNDDIWAAFTKPFRDIAEILKGKSTARKVLTGLFTVLLAAIAIAGLIFSCLACKASLATFVTDTFANIAPKGAVLIGIIVGGVAASVSRAYFTFKAAMDSCVLACKRAFGKIEGKISWKKLFSAVVDAVAAGLFFGQGSVGRAEPLGQTAAAVVTTTTRMFVSDYSHLYDPEVTADDITKQKSSSARVSQLLKMAPILKEEAAKPSVSSEASETYSMFPSETELSETSSSVSDGNTFSMRARSGSESS